MSAALGSEKSDEVADFSLEHLKAWTDRPESVGGTRMTEVDR